MRLRRKKPQLRPRECSYLRGRFAYGGATLGVGARLRVLERPPFFRFEVFSCWNSIEFMSNFYGAGLQKAIERYHTKAYVLPNAAKEAPLAATMLRLRADYRRQTQFQRTIKKELSTMALYTPEYQPNGKEIAVIKTSKGDIRVQLAGDDAPIHVGNFVELARKGFYDNLKFHRYVPGFVIQGGCPNTRDLDSAQVIEAAGNPWAGLGTGGPGYCIKQEYTTNPNNSHEDGALAMARSANPDSAGSQFYLCLGPQHNLDSGYTVFGQTIEGKDVIGELRVGDVIETIEIENAD